MLYVGCASVLLQLQGRALDSADVPVTCINSTIRNSSSIIYKTAALFDI